MQVKHSISKTTAELNVTAEEQDLKTIKDQVLKQFQKTVKLAGFRQGKAPLNLVEKNVNQDVLQSEFIQEAVSTLYELAVRKANLRVVDRPEINLTKFVPFTTVEFTATVPVVGDIKLGDYKKLKASKEEVKITKKDVDEVLSSLQTRQAEKKDVDRASKEGDQVWIDFTGKDSKGEPVQGADGKEYPLLLGSNTFIPGFEPELAGLKTGDKKSFTVTFPKDYRVKSMADQDITFDVVVNKVQEVIEPKLDDEFAKSVGPFTSLNELRKDINKHITAEREQQALRDYESALVKDLADKSTIEVPQVMVDNEVERMFDETKRNIVHRGITIQEFLQQEDKTEEEYKKDVLQEQAETRVKAGLALAEVAEAEDLRVSNEELEIRIQVLKGQYQDAKMQAELDKPENRRDIASRLLTEKTITKIKSYVK